MEGLALQRAVGDQAGVIIAVAQQPGLTHEVVAG
jgi:hypothetical protein